MAGQISVRRHMETLVKGDKGNFNTYENYGQLTTCKRYAGKSHSTVVEDWKMRPLLEPS